MKEYNRQPALLIIALLLLSLSACTPRPVAFVAVREAKFRCEGERGQRIKLPLTAESRERLMKFFRSGGVSDSVSTLVDPEAEKKYGPVLDSLGDNHNLTLGDDLSKHVFCEVAVELCRNSTRFAKRQSIRQVIDARETGPPKIDPVAVMDDSYWWVFSHSQVNGQHVFTELLVMKAIPLRMKR
jgi:hypothetical protein